jgi:PAS domain S-box-containing protein
VLPTNLQRPKGEKEVNARAVSPSLDDSLLRSFVEALPDPCVVIDGAGRVLAVNRAWRELPRRKEAAVAASHPVGMDYLALFKSSTADEGVARALMGIKSVLGGQREHFEHEYIRPMQPTFRWFRMTVHPWRELGTKAIIFHRDITAEKLGHVTPHPVDLEFRSLADAAPVMIWMSGPGKECIFVSRQWLEFTGARLEEALGEGWPQLVHPDDRDGLLMAFRAAFDQKHEFAHEYRLRHKDGGYRWVRDRGSPRYNPQNQFLGFTGSVWDLSEQKRAAEEASKAGRHARLVQEVAVIANSATTMREALQRSVDVICEAMAFPVAHALLINDDEPGLAKSAHIVYVKDGERFATLFEMSSRLTWPTDLGAPGEVLRSGKPLFTDVFANTKFPKRYPRSQASYDAGLRGGVHLPILVDDKVEAIIEFGSEEVIADDQEIVHTLVAAGERLSRFFERRRAQIKFLAQKEELQASAQRLFAMAGRLVDSQEEERRRIAREIHDDFTQRLALVSVRIANLAGRDRAATRAEMDAGLEDVRESIVGVAGDLRDLSHQLHPTMLALLGLGRALRALCEEFQRARGIETVFEASASDQDASEPAAICLYRVLQESLMNIAKHSGSTSARVIFTRQADQLEMQVRDEGRGFDPDAEGRQGLGLVSIEERVRLLNGTLTVNSSPGKGTEIVVCIPATPAPGQ